MKITVITPCYNPGRFLKPMLESVAAQGEIVCRHIVMDGASNDGTLEVLREWAKTHPYFEFISEKDNGQSDACQKALDMVETEYFCWLNADDMLCNGALTALQAKTISSTTPPAIVYGDYLRIDSNGEIICERRQPTFNYWDCLHGYITVQNAAAIFNAPMLRSAGGFKVGLRFVMDYDIILKLGKIGEVVHVKKFCGAFRIHADSKTTTLDNVYKAETEMLRSEYGVTRVEFLRRVYLLWAKCRVAWRMVFQGCLRGRLY